MWKPPGTVPSCLRRTRWRARVDDPAEHPLGPRGGFVITKTAPIQLVSSTFGGVRHSRQAGLAPTVSCAAPRAMTPAPPPALCDVEALWFGFRSDSFDFVRPERWGRWRSRTRRKNSRQRRAPPALPRTGDTGAASAALALLCALEAAAPDDQILLADAEGASAAALALKLGGRPAGIESIAAALSEPRVHLSWHAYLGHRRYLPDQLPIHTRSEGAYVSPAAWRRRSRRACDFSAPAAGHAGSSAPATRVCPDCGGEDLEAFARGAWGGPRGYADQPSGAPSNLRSNRPRRGVRRCVIDLTDGCARSPKPRRETRGARDRPGGSRSGCAGSSNRRAASAMD